VGPSCSQALSAIAQVAALDTISGHVVRFDAYAASR
jgi:hypothetical protein